MDPLFSNYCNEGSCETKTQAEEPTRVDREVYRTRMERCRCKGGGWDVVDVNTVSRSAFDVDELDHK